MRVPATLRRVLSPLIGFLRQEFGFVSGNYRILIISWMIMDVAMETPVPYYQKYVQALGGEQFPMALGVIGFCNFIAMAAVAFPGGYLADKYGRRWLITTMTLVWQHHTFSSHWRPAGTSYS